jgi:serine/threonine protein kinase
MAIDHPTEALPPGYRLGGYEILRVLGRGGFGMTYQARRKGLAGEMVAIKELYPGSLVRRTPGMTVEALPGTHPSHIADSIEMFLREARLICALDHPNIVHGVEAFRGNGTGYLVMRYVSGKNLRDSLRDPGGFRPGSGSLPALLGPLLDGLETLHGHDLLHCDIKPDNIFLGVGFEPILIDLGSARWHVPGVGTEEASTYSHYFSAIEQMSDRFGPIGPWTDIYQLSAVVYRCMTGGKLPDSVDRAEERADPFVPLREIPEVVAAYPQALIESIDRGLQLRPDQRPRSIGEWRRPMEAILAATRPPAAQAKPQAKPQASCPEPLSPRHTGERLLSDPKQLVSREPAAFKGPEAGGPDFLLWTAGGLLVIILIIVMALASGSCGQ